MADTPKTTQKVVKILVVEDSPTQLEELRFLLEEAGFSVAAAANGKEALAAAKANAIELVISDIVMPEMDGYALCKALRADETLRHLPVILLTSLADPRDVIHGLESGANNFICKPYDDRALLARVQSVLANQEIRKATPSEMGINIFFAGQQFFITADRLQILDLLLSTYENAVNRNSELIRTRDELRILNEQLEVRVAERTAALTVEIEERKRAEEALRESEKRFRQLAETMPDAMLVGQDGRNAYANFAAARLLRAAGPEELVGLDIFAVIDSAHHERAHQAMQRALAGGEHPPFEDLFVRLDGTTVPVEISVALSQWRGQPALQVIARDITERKRGEERIVHLNRILRAVRDINQLIVRERERQRLIEDACRLLVEARGYESAMVILTDEAGVPRAWAEAGLGGAFQPLDESLQREVLPQCCRLARQHEGVYHVTDPAEVCCLCPIGAECASSDASCIELRHGGTTYGYFSVSVDRGLGVDTEEDSILAEVAGDVAYALHGIERAEAMTRAEQDRDRAEGELRQSQKMEAVGRLAGGVAHDFNNILTVINASCSFLEEGLQKSEPLLEDVRTISEAAQSAARLTRQLLAFSRRQVLEPRPLDLNALVAESEKMLGRLIGEDVTIRVEAAPALGLVLADPGQLEQVIVNLAVNARDAMPTGGTLTITTANVELDEVFVSRCAGSSAGPFVMLAVTDTGVGMDAETLARVFEPFFTTKEVGKGTGLGLSTVYGIVNQSGGFIAVNSEPGRGTTFEIYLPRVVSVGQPWQLPSEAGSSRGRGETILLVEDNDQLRAVAMRALGKLGYRVFGAAGLDEARRIAATEEPIHLLLTDVVMPGGSGHDVHTAVAAAHPAVKALYMSGFTDEAIAHRGVLEPGTAFLHKPFTPDSLGRKVREVLDG